MLEHVELARMEVAGETTLERRPLTEAQFQGLAALPAVVEGFARL